MYGVIAFQIEIMIDATHCERIRQVRDRPVIHNPRIDLRLPLCDAPREVIVEFVVLEQITGIPVAAGEREVRFVAVLAPFSSKWFLLPFPRSFFFRFPKERGPRLPLGSYRRV